ncbi:hypothetical protein KKC06_06790 [Patescibacteria group bacterium]|nr:hypothetical protein [Patescibacteria group bacterium]
MSVKYFIKGYRVARSPKQKKFNQLIKWHFTREEARKFSCLRRLDYTEMTVMRAKRSRQYSDFVHRNKEELEPGTRRFNLEWRKFINKWYRRSGHTTIDIRFRRVPDPWDWFGSVSQKLPPEERYPTELKKINAAAKREGEKRKKARELAEKTRNQRYIAELRKSIAATDDPERKAQFRQQIRNLGGKA